MWTPVAERTIKKDIEYCGDLLFDQPACLRFWEYIQITPEKWVEKTMGQDGGGFWVVAIIGKSVIYYNDIEEGYNRSPFTRYGEIDEYSCSQMELHEMVTGLVCSMKSANNGNGKTILVSTLKKLPFLDKHAVEANQATRHYPVLKKIKNQTWKPF